MTSDEIIEKYSSNYQKYLLPIAKKLEVYVTDIVNNYPRIDRVVSRAKSIESFTDKALKEFNGKPKYLYPFTQIQDQIGVRIICFYKSDIEQIEKMIKDYFTPIEKKKIVPDDEKQFDYEGLHFILFIPDDIRDIGLSKEKCPEVFELQIKTLYQHAWAEANHDLAYKPEAELSKDQKRKIAFTAAQSWGADEIFNDLYTHLSD